MRITHTPLLTYNAESTIDVFMLSQNARMFN